MHILICNPFSKISRILHETSLIQVIKTQDNRMLFLGDKSIDNVCSLSASAVPCVCLPLLFVFCFYVFGKHRAYYATRVPRHSKKSPSYLNVSSFLLSPDAAVLKDWQSVNDDILDTSQNSIPDCLVKEEMHDTLAKRNLQINNNKKKPFKKKDHVVGTSKNVIDEHGNAKKVTPHVLPKLDMDHVYLTVAQLLWAYSFVGLCSYFLYVKGTIILCVRKFLARIGIKPANFDARAVVAKLLLESTMAIHYVLTSDTTDATKDGKDQVKGGTKPRLAVKSNTRKVAIFVFTRIPYINIDGSFQIADLVTVKVDLGSKKMLTCQMDDEELTPSQTMTILFFYFIFAQHVKVHALANWGVNCEDDAKNTNHQLYRNSIVTAMYNHAGYVGFGGFIDGGGWERSGLLTPGWSSESLRKVIDHGLEEQIWHHSHIVELVPHSEFVSFIVKVRAMFHNAFFKHKHLFPGVHCEALFVGTILHSLDHYQAECILQDPLWLDVNDGRFGKMAELGRVVRVGFTEDLPGLHFPRRFKSSRHPFYELVYAKAAKMNKHFADKMDTCICK